MNKKYQLFNLCSLLLIILSFHACKNCCEDVECVQYNFKVPVEISPKRDTFNIGDTVTFTSRFHHELEDNVDGRTYKLIDYEFYPFARMSKIIQDSIQNGLFTEFTDVIVTAQRSRIIFNSDGNNSLIFQYNYEQDIYETIIQFILKEKGLYTFGMLSQVAAEEAGGDINKFDGWCGLRRQDPIYFMNEDQEDNNYHMLESVKIPFVQSITKEDFDRGGNYAFIVK